jgi:hypothetical protein
MGNTGSIRRARHNQGYTGRAIRGSLHHGEVGSPRQREGAYAQGAWCQSQSMLYMIHTSHAGCNQMSATDEHDAMQPHRRYSSLHMTWSTTDCG